MSGEWSVSLFLAKKLSPKVRLEHHADIAKMTMMRQQDVRLLKVAVCKPCADRGEVKVFSKKCLAGTSCVASLPAPTGEIFALVQRCPRDTRGYRKQFLVSSLTIPTAWRNELQVVVPTNLKPRFSNTLLRASDFSTNSGIS